MIKEYISVEEFAEMLAISKQTARNIMKVELPYIKIGNTYRIPRQYVDEYIYRNTLNKKGD